VSSEWIITIIAISVTLVEILGILTAIHAVMNTRTSQGAIAWGISLVTFPWLALPLYAVFGRSKFKGYASIRHFRDETARQGLEECHKEAAEGDLILKDRSRFDGTLTRLVDLPITRFNKSRLLVDGEATFQRIFDSIAAAVDYILVEFYIVKDDNLGRELKSRLISKARENVRVYFLYDEIGSHKLPLSYIREMKAAGIFTSAFHSTQGKTNQFQLNFRNHRKIVIVDGKTAYVGGHNVGDEYVSGHPKLGPWRDTHVELTGPVVQEVQFCFIQDWFWATSRMPDLNWHLTKSSDGSEETLIIPSGPADPFDTCALMFTHVINSARERIWIASPYFVPDRQIIGALKLAALRGVDVRILLPEKPDHRVVHLASFAFYQNTIPLGIQLYRYTAGFMHQKVFLVDSTCAAVGTANLDNRSFRLNFELTFLNYDRSFIDQIDDMLQNDFTLSRKAALEDYIKKPFYFRLAVRFASLLSPIL
jgi:cardiolipin synthase